MAKSKQCIYCGAPLLGRQTRYCSEAHRAAYRRANAAGSTDNGRPVNPDGRAAGQATSSDGAPGAAGAGELVTFEALRVALARSEGATAVLENQNAALSAENQRLTERVISVTADNARLAAELQHERQQLQNERQARDVAPAAGGRAAGRVVYLALTIAVLGILALAFGFAVAMGML